MSFFKFTSDKTIKRLRWVMVCTMLFDSSITLLGQPSSYWQHPHTMREGNGFFRYFFSQGLPVYVLTILIYISVVFLLISILPRRLALVGVFSFILGHYFGASTWLAYYWHLGINAPIIYGIILGMVFVHLAFPTPDKPSPEKSLSNESDATSQEDSDVKHPYVG
jgi:hypothetical protein